MIYTRDIIGDQKNIFFQALALGAVLGACWDIFRFAGLFLPKKGFAMIAKDVLFCLWAGFITFSFLLNVNFGMPRGYICFAEAAGFLAWYISLGRVNFKIAKLIKKALSTIFRPVLKIFAKAFSALKKITGEVKIFFGKIYLCQKKLLKNRQRVLYNKLYLSKRKAFSICGEKAGKEHGSFERSGTEKEKEHYPEDCSYCIRSISSLYPDSNSGKNK